MSIPAILEAIRDYSTRLALVTGGEPLLQQSVYGLFGSLLELGYTVCVETGGHLSLKDVDPRVHKIMDLKCPSSRMMDRNDYGNIAYLTRSDEVKFVIGDRTDFDWACETTRKFDLPSRVNTVLYSPVHNVLPCEKLARWVLDSGLRIRLQIQLHRVIWPDVKRGV